MGPYVVNTMKKRLTIPYRMCIMTMCNYTGSILTITIIGRIVQSGGVSRGRVCH